MAKPVVLPSEIIQAIEMLRSTPVDPSDFSNAVQECYNRGFGKMGKWIAEHKVLYLQALQDGYASELNVPNSEKDILPPIDADATAEDIPPSDDDMETEMATPSTFPDKTPDGDEPTSGKRHKRQ